MLHRPPPDWLPLLITGISGVAGYNALLHFRRLFPGQVIGIRPPQTYRLVGEGVVALDLNDVDGLHQLFAAYRFKTVLHCSGNCALKPCELNPGMARRINVDGAVAVAECSARFGSRLVHLSSDLVFSGVADGGYSETDPVDPVTVYGQTMAEAEERVAVIDPSAAMLRISLPMGPSFNRHAGAIDWIQSRFRAHRPATLYFDEVRSCTYVEDLNRVFAEFLWGKLRRQGGLFHTGGPRPISLYEIGQVVNRVGGYAHPLLQGCPRVEAGPMPPRAGNVSMRSDRLVGLLGYQPFRPWPLEPRLWPSHRGWHAEREDFPGSLEELSARLYRIPVTGPEGSERPAPLAGPAGACP